MAVTVATLLQKAPRLERLAAPLKPEKAPWYVWRSTLTPSLRRHFPADGWYWIPAGGSYAVYLAATFEDAAYELRRLLERAEAES